MLATTIMGRRNRSRRNDDDNDNDVGNGDDGDYSLERTEKEWLLRRRMSKRRRGGEEEEEEVDNDDHDVAGKKRKNEKRNKKATVDGSTESLSPSGKTRDEDDDAMRGRTGRTVMDDDDAEDHRRPSPSSAMDDKIERTRMKRRLQKERRREKKKKKNMASVDASSSRKAEKLSTTKPTNGNRPGHDGQYVTLARGVRCMDLSIGRGPTVVHRKNVRVSYTLRSKSHASGKVLDSSGNFGFHFGKGEVIKGWDIGLVGMKVGGVRRLVVPPSAGYGNRDVGAGAGGDLYFQIELLHVAP